MSLAACSNSEEYAQLSEPVELQVTAGIGNGAKTRTSSVSGYIDWTTGAQMTVRATNATESHSDATYKLKSGTTYGIFEEASTGSGFVFEPSETSNLTFVAFSDNSSTAPTITTSGSDAVVAVTATNAKFTDLLRATASANATSPTVNFSFGHVMTQLTIKIVMGDITASGTPTAKLFGYYTKANVKVSDGTVTGSDQDNSTGVELGIGDSNAKTFELVPGIQALKVQVTNGSNTYTANITDDLSAGTAYNCTITLTKTSMTVGGGDKNGDDTGYGDGSGSGTSSSNSCTITDWTTSTDAKEHNATMANQ
jgi:hypothetical protein